MILYFRNSQGKMRKIAEISNSFSTEKAMEKTIKIIHKFCDERNFKIYYTRIWNAEVNGKQMTQFDVGSHTEFFFTDPIVYFPEKEVSQ